MATAMRASLCMTGVTTNLAGSLTGYDPSKAQYERRCTLRLQRATLAFVLQQHSDRRWRFLAA